MNLDFLMKLFIAIIVVMFLIIAAYFTADQLSELFGYGHFKVTKPGPNAATLKNVKVTNLTKFNLIESNYTSCVNDCESGIFVHPGSCNETCKWLCNQTGDESCKKVSVKLKIGTLSGVATLGFKGPDDFTVDTADYDLPHYSIVTKYFVFYLPESGDTHKTWFTWEVDGKSGKVYLGLTNITPYLKYGTYGCNNTYKVNCSKLYEKYNEVKSGKNLDILNEIEIYENSSFECKGLEILININCSSIDLYEYSNKMEISHIQITNNGTYQLTCPQSKGLSIDLYTSSNCKINYTLSSSNGFIWNNNIGCHKHVNVWNCSVES